MQEIFSSIEKKLLPTAKKNIFIGRSSLAILFRTRRFHKRSNSFCTGYAHGRGSRSSAPTTARCFQDEGNSGLRVARRDRRMNAAANIEIADHSHFARLARLNEIVENLVDHGFVESAFVAIGPQIELQRFKLDTELIGNVMDSDRGKIRLSRARTNTGELGTFHVNLIVALRSWVGEGLELFTRLGCHERS